MSEKNEIFYCIGDSHVSFFSGQDKIQPLWPKQSENSISFFKTFRLGAVLADSITRYGSSLKGKELLEILLDRRIPDPSEWQIPKEAKVIFCFGEIDCRFHVIKQAEKQNKSIKSIAEDLASRYVDSLLNYKKLGYKIIIWNAVPSTNPAKINPEYPHYGTYEQRIEATYSFNKFIEQKCEDSDLVFLSIYDKITNEKGEADMNFYMDEVHLSQKAMPLLINEMKKKFPEITFELKDKNKIPQRTFFKFFKK